MNVQVEYWGNGHVKCVVHRDGDVLHGSSTTWTADGVLYSTALYDHGVQVAFDRWNGRYSTCYEIHRKGDELTRKQTMPDGSWRYDVYCGDKWLYQYVFHASGQIAEYRDSRRQREWYENGQFKGKGDGTMWSRNGRLVRWKGVSLVPNIEPDIEPLVPHGYTYGDDDSDSGSDD